MHVFHGKEVNKKRVLNPFAPRGAQGLDILPPLLAVVFCLSCYCPCVPSILSLSFLFLVCLCFSSPRASIQSRQQHCRCSLLSSGHVQSSLIPQYIQFVSLHLSGHLRCRSCPVHAPYIPVSHHKSQSLSVSMELIEDSELPVGQWPIVVIVLLLAPISHRPIR